MLSLSLLCTQRLSMGRGENLRTEGEAAPPGAAVGPGSCCERGLRTPPTSPPAPLCLPTVPLNNHSSCPSPGSFGPSQQWDGRPTHLRCWGAPPAAAMLCRASGLLCPHRLVWANSAALAVPRQAPWTWSLRGCGMAPGPGPGPAPIPPHSPPEPETDCSLTA